MWDQKEMPFTEHLRELRNRLIICLVTVGVLAAALFWPAQFVIPWLARTYFPGVELNAFGPADVILAEFKFSIYAGIGLSLPVILYQMWMFVVPAFHPKTRRMVYAYVAPSIFLGLAGVAFAHFLVLPKVTASLMHITSGVAKATFGIDSTLNLILVLLLAFAIVFQTPVVMILLARIGLINSKLLRKYWRYSIMAIILLAGLAAPDGSPFTMGLLAAPMFVLYGASFWIIVVLEKSWKRERAT
jgi:sec-independent protein translocase protein TatC